MFQNLPEMIQQQILSLLEANNFKAARDLRDAFVESQLGEDDAELSDIQDDVIVV